VILRTPEGTEALLTLPIRKRAYLQVRKVEIWDSKKKKKKKKNDPIVYFLPPYFP